MFLTERNERESREFLELFVVSFDSLLLSNLCHSRDAIFEVRSSI